MTLSIWEMTRDFIKRWDFITESQYTNFKLNDDKL